MEKSIFVTVDTECHHIEKLNRYITGDTPKGNYGLEKLLQTGNELGIPINVFLDIPECHIYGEDYIKNIIALIKKYGHPICLHVHPDYIGDLQRKHLWEYTETEQETILRTAISDYIRLCGPQERLFFRAGAWGVNSVTYDVLAELKKEFGLTDIVDLSYVYHSRRRCRLSYEEYRAVNACRTYKGVSVFPNTEYIGFDYFGKQLPVGITVPGTCLGEFKKLINQNRLENITYTMHSWDFMKRWFFFPNKLSGDKQKIRKFKKCVEYAQKNGYKFENLNNINFTDEEDQYINLCSGIKGKITSLWYNYLRFADIGRSYKKYALLYFAPIILLAVIAAVICAFVL